MGGWQQGETVFRGEPTWLEEVSASTGRTKFQGLFGFSTGKVGGHPRVCAEKRGLCARHERGLVMLGRVSCGHSGRRGAWNTAVLRK
jgi:hypothetical protein